MKKYLLVLFLMMFLCPSIGAQTFKRTTKMPSFFVPKGALQTENKPEKLVPIEVMQRMLLERNPEMMAEYRRREQEKALEKQRKEQEEALERQNKELEEAHERHHREHMQAVQKEQEEFKKTENTLLSTAEEDNTKDEHVDSAKESDSEINKAKKSFVDEPIVSPEDEEFFAQIIEEYRRNILEVSKGKTDLDKRIVEMVADYKNYEHRI